MIGALPEEGFKLSELATKIQKTPTEDERSELVGEKLKELIDKRTALGIKKYGTPLKIRNGRDALVDALQESIDLNQYLMQECMELRQDIEDLTNENSLLKANRKL